VVEKKETSCFEKGTTNLLRDRPGTTVGEIGVGIQAGAYLEAVLAHPVRYFTPKS
jgi:hypothetical protein